MTTLSTIRLGAKAIGRIERHQQQKAILVVRRLPNRVTSGPTSGIAIIAASGEAKKAKASAVTERPRWSISAGMRVTQFPPIAPLAKKM